MAADGPTRRKAIAGLCAFAASGLTAAGRSQRVEVRIDPGMSPGVTPKDFVGLGYEISSVASPGLLSAGNSALLPFIKTLGSRGVIRVGGNTSDFSIWSPEGQAVSLPKGTVTSRASIRDLGTFLAATGWDLIWGVNLGTGTAESAADQAAEVAAAARERLLAVEVGNEPDLFPVQGHRPNGYSYSDYHREFRNFFTALRQRTPGLPFAGPDVAISPDWVIPFAQDEKSNIKLLTEHYYAGGPPENPSVTIENLLKADEHFLSMIKRLQAVSRSSGVPYRLVELNSCYGGGKPGVSDTFASALWGLDLMFTLASAGGAGINWETGLNHLGRVSSYSPIWDDEHGHYSARPLYYALLAFTKAGIGRRFQADVAAQAINFTGYGVETEGGQIWVTLINKDLQQAADVTVRSAKRFSGHEVLPLTAPAYDSRNGVTLGGSAVSDQGSWHAPHVPRRRISGGELNVQLAPASAALVRLS